MPLSASQRDKSAAWTALAGFSVLPAIGIACYRLPAWSMFRSVTGYLGDELGFISHILQALVIVLYLIIDHFITYDEKRLLHVAGISTVFVIAGSLLIFCDSAGGVLSYLGSALCSVAGAAPLLVWGYYFCSVRPAKSTFELSLAFALYGIATQLLGMMPTLITDLLTIACPIISFICLKMSIQKDDALIPAETVIDKKMLKRLPWGIMIVLGVCTVSNVLAKFLVPTATTIASPLYRFVWPLLFFSVFVLFCIWIFALKRDDPDRLWPIFALIIFSGLLCYAALSPSHPGFAGNFFRATQDCLMLFCWIIAASFAYRLGLPRIAFFGVMTFVFVKPPTLIPTLITLFLPAEGIAAADTSAVIVVAVTAFILICATVVCIIANGMHSKDEGGEGSLPGNGGDSIADEVICNVLQAKYGLTEREGEVALLLSKGHTMNKTAEELCISLDTVRAHSKSLYRKMGIHKKEELIATTEKLLAEEKC